MPRKPKTDNGNPASNGASANRWRNRITGYGEVDPTTLLANRKNYRIHPQSQAEALGSILDTVGWVHVAAIINQRTGFVVDGHLRVSMAIARKEKTIPVGYVDLTDEEEDIVLASFDPIAAGAVTDADKLNALLEGIDLSVGDRDNDALNKMFAGLFDEGRKTSLQDVGDDDANNGNGGRSSKPRHAGDKRKQIKPVLYAAEVATFESALRATGEINRGKALMQVCRYYLDHGNSNTTRQFDVHFEDPTAL